MSKSPAKDFSRLIDHAKTAKKEDTKTYDYQTSYKYEVSNIANDLKIKLDLALRQNTRLLDENSTHADTINQLRYQIQNYHQHITFTKKQAEDLLKKTSLDRQNLLIEVELKQRSHESQLSKLLQEISRLHEEKNNLEMGKQKEIETLKAEYEKSLFVQLQNVRNCQINSKQLYEAQIRNLKEAIDQSTREIQNVKALDKLQKNRLNDHIRTLEKEIKHIRNAHSIELQSVKNQLENQLNSEKRRIENQKELEISGYNIKLKRLKKDVLEKNLEVQHLSKKMYHQEELLSIESGQFKKERENLLSELKSNDIHAKNTISREKNKLSELNQLEVQNLTKLYETNIEELTGENSKLKELIECKKQQIRDIYDENTRIKESFGAENKMLRNENKEVKERMKKFELENKEEMEMFKIKISTLIQNDIKAMTNYYENQLRIYIDGNNDLLKMNAEIKQRLFAALQENDELRKNFEIEISKQKARVQDLKIKLASIQLEHKEHASSLGSKIQLTSQTLIRETDHKEKSKTQYEEEKRKFHYLANSKDKQIAQLMAMIENLKAMHDDQLKVVRTEKMELRSQLEEAQLQAKRAKDQSDKECRVKDQRLRNLVFSNQKQLQEIKELQDKIEVLEKNNIKLKKQIDHLTLINNSIAQELGLSKGFIESFKLESSAAIEDERSKLKQFLGSHEVNIRDYFEDKLKSREKDVENLQKQLSEKEQDIRDLIVKYNALEKRLEIMLETHAKLTDFEQKIKSLGLDNNLVANMAELFNK